MSTVVFGTEPKRKIEKIDSSMLQESISILYGTKLRIFLDSFIYVRMYVQNIIYSSSDSSRSELVWNILFMWMKYHHTNSALLFYFEVIIIDQEIHHKNMSYATVWDVLRNLPTYIYNSLSYYTVFWSKNHTTSWLPK